MIQSVTVHFKMLKRHIITEYLTISLILGLYTIERYLLIIVFNSLVHKASRHKLLSNISSVSSKLRTKQTQFLYKKNFIGILSK